MRRIWTGATSDLQESRGSCHDSNEDIPWRCRLSQKSASVASPKHFILTVYLNLYTVCLDEVDVLIVTALPMSLLVVNGVLQQNSPATGAEVLKQFGRGPYTAFLARDKEFTVCCASAIVMI
jgi:hypothetical protein